MGRLINGINGPFWGKLGTAIGSSRNGVPYIKGLYRKRTKNVSERELANRKKFAAAQAWLRPLLYFVQVGFRGYSQRSQGFIAAKSWLLKNAFDSTESGMIINPALVKVSSGSLPLPENLAVSLTETGDFKFTWDPVLKDDRNASHDQIMMLAYDPEAEYAKFITTGQFFKTGTDTLTVDWKRVKKFQVYAAFNAHDRNGQSDSVYLGEWKR
jgi:Family of unknown function (DUF6266)